MFKHINFSDGLLGAWTGRGFHYQHLLSTLILVRQWAGLAPPGHLVPEEFEDWDVALVLSAVAAGRRVEFLCTPLPEKGQWASISRTMKPVGSLVNLHG